MSERESLPYDVVSVGGGPAGPGAAIRLKQVNPDLTVCIPEKGSEVGAHILSGAVVDPKALDQLLPEWRTQGCPVKDEDGFGGGFLYHQANNQVALRYVIKDPSQNFTWVIPKGGGGPNYLNL